jgi:hypothetical protein
LDLAGPSREQVIGTELIGYFFKFSRKYGVRGRKYQLFKVFKNLPLFMESRLSSVMPSSPGTGYGWVSSMKETILHPAG